MVPIKDVDWSSLRQMLRTPMPPTEARTTAAHDRSPTALAFLLVATLTQLPYFVAVLAPPPGRAFVGAYFAIDDFYNYLSFVRQAEEGRFVFENKLLLPGERPGLINLEWWAVGRLTKLFGTGPFLPYRLFSLLASLALLHGVDRWARACGLPASHRFPALLFVSLGGGLGGWIFEFTSWPVSRCLDLGGLYPFGEMLLNPHFTAGTALLLWGLWLHAAADSLRGHAAAAAVATVLGLVRPYDLVTLVATRVLAVAITLPWREGLVRVVPLLALLPVAGYNAWVFFLHEGFSFYARIQYAYPARLDFLPALAPPLVLSIPAWRGPSQETKESRFRQHLACWLVVSVLVMIFRPGQFSSQYLVGMGLPLLLLGALGLARFHPRATLLAVVTLSFTSIVSLRITLSGDPAWFVPAGRLEAALILRQSCRPDDIFLGPPDVGLYSIGLSSCRAVISHEVAPGFRERLDAMRRFYGSQEAAARSAWLDSLCVTHLMLPGDAGLIPTSWLGNGTPFRKLATLGRDDLITSLYIRQDQIPCHGSVAADSRSALPRRAGDSTR